MQRARDRGVPGVAGRVRLLRTKPSRVAAEVLATVALLSLAALAACRAGASPGAVMRGSRRARGRLRGRRRCRGVGPRRHGGLPPDRLARRRIGRCRALSRRGVRRRGARRARVAGSGARRRARPRDLGPARRSVVVEAGAGDPGAAGRGPGARPGWRRRWLRLDQIVDDPARLGFDLRFGGHRANIPAWKSGCVVCLYSCPGGKVGNARYTVRDWTKQTTRFTVKKGVLPERRRAGYHPHPADLATFLAAESGASPRRFDGRARFLDPSRRPSRART